MSGRTRGLVLGFASILVLPALLVALATARFPAPRPVSPGERFDVIVVLGFPARSDGAPSAILAERIDAAARFWRVGAAPRLLVSGGAVHNAQVEAEVMAARARAQGVPDGALVLEPLARNTRENARHTAARMRAEGWRRALVVSSPSHLRRAAHWFRHEGIDAAFAPAAPVGALGSVREALAQVWEAALLLCVTPEAGAGRP